ncbi:tlde1 domain-containing protein [Jejubacter calystegiae]|nr:tlde1 domain-containing protein [Jejubacter calystegiae]
MYAGAPDYKNNPDLQCVVNKGPLPRGKYTIGRPIAHHPTAGRFVLRLTPYASNNMCGRAGFLIHGDNGRGTASNGCIVASFDIRRQIAESADRELIVK